MWYKIDSFLCASNRQCIIVLVKLRNFVIWSLICYHWSYSCVAVLHALCFGLLSPLFPPSCYCMSFIYLHCFFYIFFVILNSLVLFVPFSHVHILFKNDHHSCKICIQDIFKSFFQNKFSTTASSKWVLKHPLLILSLITCFGQHIVGRDDLTIYSFPLNFSH